MDDSNLKRFLSGGGRHISRRDRWREGASPFSDRGNIQRSEMLIRDPGEGTTFRIYLPRHAGDMTEERADKSRETIMGRGERVLVVEDDVTILKMADRILTRLNYTVLTAGTPGEAFRLAEVHNRDIDLLITDVVMPEMNGRELAQRLRSTHCPHIKCLYMSGYTADVIAHRGVPDKGFKFVQKPFSKEVMAEKVRAILDAD